ncbi:MAG: hypothetical protein Q9227_003324 [Pyrenula ochraceoflavens]
MPAKRKQGAAASAGKGKKKQAKQSGQKAPSRKLDIPVDEGFGAGSDCHVYVDDDGVIFNGTLNQTNVGNNNNKFYVLQLLVDEDNDRYFTHTRWGRVGEFGQVKTMDSDSLDGALAEYNKKFKDKTGYTWEDRNEPPKAKKYTFIEKNYEADDDDDEDDKKKVKSEPANDDSTPSKLPMQTQRLMELIFNQNHFNSVLEEIGYNADKMPLGKLGKPTLKKGMEHLKELASLIKHPSLAQNKYGISREAAIEDFTNKYYSTIPHVFGRNKPPMINNDDILKREVAMLDTLTDMEVATNIMNADGKQRDAQSVSLLDQRFNSLGMDEMTPLGHSSNEYKKIQDYLIDSASTGHGLRFRLQDVFRIERNGESARFEKSRFAKIKDKNRLLLWHGSRTTNYGGILSQGLRIAPPEAPVNGYAFGKGVYLADVSSKSANYCSSGMSGGVGLLLLVEAELSRPMYEIPTGNSMAQEEAKKHNCISTMGVGRQAPQKWKDASCVHDDLKGVLMPDGKIGDNKKHQGGYLMYNEYIAYDVAQLRIRYLLRVGM